MKENSDRKKITKKANCTLQHVKTEFPSMMGEEGLRDDAHMASMKTVQFSRPPPRLSIYVRNSSTSSILDI